ncbi:MAG: CHASE2 domain-containing protein [Nitrospinaceae bacterium]|nr:adenylate/guanylate cyclase domain-containing protein [Nitrospinaceae bacterium]NIR57117.1 adenylate/guanylate cyclase domain-containing protein [Nitrospinaceae bacterium]NIS87558.1 adenylate/guanylate cyclase domain-containing protein [Nitrospinaceae bacterium]NIT84428.1 adenylate/guanylate cyclase domain-containing protein [Nitrospinaceae bacterium]NIU46615.1 adenylate/guanylate cyclase domain-containing protein [Nitrospinaceae bacterium]
MKIRRLNAFTVSLFITLVSLYLYSLHLPFFQILELKAYDLKVSLRGTRPVSGQAVIVAIDEASLKQEGRWPWPRTRLADLVEKLSQSGAAVIGLDLLFPEKDIYIPFDQVRSEIADKDLTGMDRKKLMSWLEQVGDSDSRFADALRRSERAVLGYFVYPNEEQARGSAEAMGEKEFQLLDFSQYSLAQFSETPARTDFLPTLYAVGLSLSALMNAANSAGYTSYVAERDGVIRRVPMVQAHHEALFPPLSLQVLREATRLNSAVRVFPDRIAEIRLGDIPIPVSEQGHFLINYYGPERTFTHFSASDVLNGSVGADQLKNKIVLVGATGAALHDLHTSPYGPLFPGVEVHASIIENILQQDFLQRPSWVPVLDMLVILGTGLMLGLAALYFKAFGTAVFLVAGIFGYLVADYVFFARQGLWVHTVYPVFSQLLVYFGLTLYRFTFEEREKRFIKGAFSQYLAPAVVDRLVENPTLLKLGGERKVLTAFFSDVAGFSTIAERLKAEELVDLLNDYLTEMTDIVMRYEGTVDKFEGDAIIAFFGAPIDFQDHATRTCYAALDMQKRLAELRGEWKKEGRHELFMRVGINTGQVVVGNMGSKNRFDYTMIGDPVNLAARLEGVNKQYQTHTMISEYTHQLAQHDIEARELDSIRVVGKGEPIKIYELLGRKGEMDDNIRAILPFFREGLEHYKNQRWEEGITCFEQALDRYEDDGPSLTYFERCITFQHHPPPPDWDGVFGMRTK